MTERNIDERRWALLDRKSSSRDRFPHWHRQDEHDGSRLLIALPALSGRAIAPSMTGRIDGALQFTCNEVKHEIDVEYA